MIGLFWPNRAQAATITGGSWLAGRPVTKVGGHDLTDVARSTDTAAASTVIAMDLGAAMALRAFAMAGTNLSDAATWVIKVGTAAGAGDVLTTAALPAWHLATETALAAIGAHDTAAYHLRRYHNIHVHAAHVTGRYVTFEITDTTNAAGYIDVGRCFAGGGYVPTVNVSYGMPHQWEDLSTASRAESGARWVAARRRLRSATLQLEHRTQAEADILHDLQRLCGTTDDVLYVRDITDMPLTQRYGFVGHLRELSPIEHPMWDSHALNIAVEEIA